MPGAEAIRAILKRTEDNWDRLIIILSGPEEQMGRLLTSNPRLASRFATRINFSTYSSAELMTIAESLLEGSSEVLTADARMELSRMLDSVVLRNLIDKLGNARFVLSLVKNSRQVRDVRVMFGTAEPEQTDLVTIQASDLQHAFADLTSKLDELRP